MTKTAIDSSLPALLEAMARLTPEERAEMQKRGAVLPHFGKTIDAQAKYGYRCKHCGKIGLEFIGEAFDNGAGIIQDKPPLGVRFSDLPWAQPKLPLHQIDRAHPRCQHCLGVLPNNNGYGIERFLVIIADYHNGRDKGFEALAEYRSKGKNVPQASHNHEGQPISVPSSYDANSDAILAATRARQEAETPGLTDAVNDLAAKTDLLGYLSKGPSGTKGKTR